MKALILAAGRGSRLHPYTQRMPKCLTELGGKTLIGRQIETLQKAGIKDILIATGFEANQLRLPGTRQILNPDWETTNMVETLFCAKTEFGDDLVVAYGDIIYESRILDALLRSPHDISIAVDLEWRSYWEHRFADPLSDAESLVLDDVGRIIEIGAPVTEINAIQAQYMGLMRFHKAGLVALANARQNFRHVHRNWMNNRPVEKAYMTDLLMEMILMGTDVHAVPVRGGWIEIDTVADYERTAAMFADGTIRRFFNPESTRRGP